jgi:peptidoglycan/LPS O-acetylase OafA/YrhL
MAASATLALKAGVWFRRGRLFMVSPVRGDHRRFQVETPLIALFKFAEPALSLLWIILPTIQGAAWGTLLMTYEKMTFTMPHIIDKMLARIGEVSYSLYLWHMIVRDEFLKLNLFDFPTDPFHAGLLTCALFVPMVGIAMLSFQIFERPFLRFRLRYDDSTSHSRFTIQSIANPTI